MHFFYSFIGLEYRSVSHTLKHMHTDTHAYTHCSTDNLSELGGSLCKLKV